MSMVAIKIEPLIFWKQLALQITFVSIASFRRYVATSDLKNVFVIESFIRDSFKNTDSSINETSEVWVSHWIINTNQFFIILILKVSVLNTLYFKYIYPGFHRQGLSLVLDKNVNLSCFNWKKLALTDLKIYQCLCFVSRCTPVIFFLSMFIKIA